LSAGAARCSGSSGRSARRRRRRGFGWAAGPGLRVLQALMDFPIDKVSGLVYVLFDVFAQTNF